MKNMCKTNWKTFEWPTIERKAYENRKNIQDQSEWQITRHLEAEKQFKINQIEWQTSDNLKLQANSKSTNLSDNWETSESWTTQFKINQFEWQLRNIWKLKDNSRSTNSSDKQVTIWSCNFELSSTTRGQHKTGEEKRRIKSRNLYQSTRAIKHPKKK